MRTLPALLSISIAALAAGAPRLAAASPSYPGDVQAHLGLTYMPNCDLCHTTNQGGPGMATTAFVINMQAQGLMQLDDPTVATALDALKAAGTDSDCNGTDDITQLENGQDPSTGQYIDGSGKTAPTESGCANSGPDPIYGCGAHAQLSAGPTPWQGAAVIATIVGLALSRGRGRRRNRA